MGDVKRILVVSRLIKDSRKAVRYGVELARAFGSQLYVIHVIYRPFGFDHQGWNVPAVVSLEEEYKKIVSDTKKELGDMIEMEKQKGMQIKEIVHEGKPTEEIFRVVKEENIDLLIVDAREEGRLEHFLFGRDNEEIIRKLPCSVLLVKQEPGRKE